MFSFEGSAEFYLNRFTKWEVESDGIEISRPEFKITNHYTDDIFKYSSIEASIPYYVKPGTPAGEYDLKVTLYDAFRSESLVLAASLNVAESEQAYSRRLGTIQLIIGIVLVIAGIVVFFFVRRSDNPDSGYIWLGILVLIGLIAIVNGIRLLVGS